MDEVVFQSIQDRVMLCKDRYEITPLSWFVRDRGIYRSNSDLDIVFIFKNFGKTKCAAIHDIIGYGLDFWGWDIHDLIQIIKISNESYYAKPFENPEDIYLSSEHRRAGLGYFGGVYWGVGNKQSWEAELYSNQIVHLLNHVMEVKIIVSYLLNGVRSRVENLQYNVFLTSYEYLNSLWRILLSKSILAGNLPGQTNFGHLVDTYMDEGLIVLVNELINVYAKALGKHSQRFTIPEMNQYIINEYFDLQRKMGTLTPEKKDTFYQDIIKLENIV